LETQIEQQTGIRPELEFSDALAAGDDIGGFIDDQIRTTGINGAAVRATYRAPIARRRAIRESIAKSNSG
jgi:hypothetical protein